jgi:uncharacterized membrane-anchored protein YjiN (DUF445 family)
MTVCSPRSPGQVNGVPASCYFAGRPLCGRLPFTTCGCTLTPMKQSMRGPHVKNRFGLYSLVAAAVGFLFVTFQPWVPLEHVVLFRGLNLRSLLTAFFDASLVGALADWFAVSALFRHPIGIPLPHTNILAKNREAIAEAVPRFLGSFVNEETIAAELGAVDFAGKVEAVLTNAAARTEIIEFLRVRLMALFAAASAPNGGGPSDSFKMIVGEMAMFAARRVDPAAVVGSFIQWGMKQGLDAPIISAVVSAAGTALQHHRDDLTDVLTPMIRRNSGWRGLFVGRGSVERLLGGALEELGRVGTDPRHDLRRLLDRELRVLAARLLGETADPAAARERLRAAFRRVAENPVTADRVASVLAAFMDRVQAAIGPEKPDFAEGVGRLERMLLSRLGNNPEFRGVFNRGVAGLISSLLARANLVEGVTGYLAELLKNTDEREFVSRVEGAVWNDLQYIRVNGAVVGGLVGVVLAIVLGVAPRN